MKRLTLFGVAAVALASLSAHAQQFQYNDGDLVLDFSRSGSSDLEVDIGNISQFTSLAPGSTITVGGYDKNNQLLATFGNLNSIQFGVIGTQAGTAADFLTKFRANPATRNSTPSDFSSSKASTVSSDVLGIVGSDGFGGLLAKGILPWSANHSFDPVANTASAVVIPTSGTEAVNSFTSLYSGTGGLKSQTTALLNTTPTSFTTPVVSDLFEYDGAGSTASAKYLGDFTLNTDGSLSYTAFGAVPEPSTYGLLAGAGLLTVVLRNRTRVTER